MWDYKEELLRRICMAVPENYNVDDVLAESWRCGGERYLILVYTYHYDKDTGRIRRDGCYLAYPTVEVEDVTPELFKDLPPPFNRIVVRRLKYAGPCPEWLSEKWKDKDDP
jgi:hypothetical protein